VPEKAGDVEDVRWSGVRGSGERDKGWNVDAEEQS